MHKMTEEGALWSKKHFPKNSLILKVQGSKFHLKLNRKYHGQIPYKVSTRKNNMSTDNEILPERFAYKIPKICNLHKGMKRARNNKDVGR